MYIIKDSSQCGNESCKDRSQYSAVCCGSPIHALQVFMKISPVVLLGWEFHAPSNEYEIIATLHAPRIPFHGTMLMESSRMRSAALGAGAGFLAQRLSRWRPRMEVPARLKPCLVESLSVTIHVYKQLPSFFSEHVLVLPVTFFSRGCETLTLS